MNDLVSGGVWPLSAATSLEMNMQILWGQAGIAGVGQGNLLLSSRLHLSAAWERLKVRSSREVYPARADAQVGLGGMEHPQTQLGYQCLAPIHLPRGQAGRCPCIWPRIRFPGME